MLIAPPLRSLVDRERQVVAFHRETLGSGSFPPPRAAATTFVHGFLLPFSLIVATLRHRTLGETYVKLAVTRACFQGVAGAVVFARLHHKEMDAWSWVVWFVSALSVVEGVVVFLTRRWDDWLAYHIAGLAQIRPDDPFPIPPRLELFDRAWLMKKAWRRARAWIVFGAGLPAFLAFRLVPSVGELLFSTASVLWGWYWLGVFTASKTSHAWIDEAIAPSPALIREIHDRSSAPWLAPVRLYARIWARLTRGVNAPAMTFERSPMPFLGLALARAICSLPGLYSMIRAVVPVAAARICAETDPYERFSLH
jgi:hypothetical protein